VILVSGGWFDRLTINGSTSLTMKRTVNGHLTQVMFHESHRYIMTQFQWGEGTTTSPTNRRPISITIEVVVILVFGGGSTDATD
jgi:hypothetical protein